MFSKGRWLPVLTLVGLLPCLSSAPAAENQPPKAGSKPDIQAVLVQLQLKRWTKELELTEKQQKQIQALLEEEARQVAKVKEEASLSIPERNAKYAEIRNATHAKIKPLLNAAQLEKWDKVVGRPSESKGKP